MIKGTVAEDIITVLKKIPERLRKNVQEVIMDMAANIQLAIKKCFTNAHRFIDRFRVQKLACDRRPTDYRFNWARYLRYVKVKEQAFKRLALQ